MKKLLLLAALLLLCMAAPAQDISKKTYIMLGGGYPNLTYSEELQDLIDILRDSDMVDELRFDIDAAIYFLRINKVHVGVSLNAAMDRFSLSETDDWFSITGYLSGASLVYHLNKEWQGLFIRGDLGTAFTQFHDDTGEMEESDTGFGYLLGVGLAFPLGEKLKLAPIGTYSSLRVEGDSYNRASIGVRLIF